MKTRMNLKSITLIIAILMMTAMAHAGEKFKVIARGHHGKAIYEYVELPLLDPAKAETADFKIVNKGDEKNRMNREAVEWANLSDDDRLRAANLLYHLTIAKNYFLNELHSEEVAKLEQIVIRINFVNDWNRLSYWSNENVNPQYNTSHTVPAGKGVQLVKDEKGEIQRVPVEWKREIWFRPAKPLSVKEILDKLPEDPLNPTIKSARDVVYPTQISTELQNGFRYLAGQSGSQQLISASTHQLGTVAVIEGAFLLMKQVNRWLLPNTYYLDAAMVPEVIYHEFSHVALSDYLIPNTGRPVVEGLADYFAAEIAQSPDLAKKIKEYARGFERSGKDHKNYSMDMESSRQSTSGYVLSLLYGLRNDKKAVGAEMATKLVWDSRKKLNTYSSDIRSDLTGAIRLSCMTICNDFDRDDMALMQYFNSRFTNNANH